MEKLNEPCQRTFSVMRRGDWIATDGLCDLIRLDAIVRYNTDDNLRRQIRIKLLREPRRILNIDLRSALHITVHGFVQVGHSRHKSFNPPLNFNRITNDEYSR